MSSLTDTTSTRRLEDKTAVIFGAGGEVGGAVAKELAAHGARLFLSGRTKTAVQDLARAITSRGQTAAAAEVDALDEDAVNNYLDDVVAAAGRIDIMFNAMGPQAVEYRNATSTLELPLEAFMLPMTTILRSQFITARAAARHFVTAGPASSSPSPPRHRKGWRTPQRSARPTAPSNPSPGPWPSTSARWASEWCASAPC